MTPPRFSDKLGGVLAGVIAASTTATLGYAAFVWFEKGERLKKKSTTA